MDEAGRAVLDCLERTYPESLTTGKGWYAQYQNKKDWYLNPDRHAKSSTQRPTSTVTSGDLASTDESARQTDDATPSSTCTALSEKKPAISDDRPHQSVPDRSAGKTVPISQRLGPKESFPHGPDPEKRQPQRHHERWATAFKPLHTRFAKGKRDRINRKRAEYKRTHPEQFSSKFLGTNVCKDCGEEPGHDDPDECPVQFYKKFGRMPRQCSLPCMYCDDQWHTVDACEYLHMRCALCGFRGHMAYECKERSTEEWLIAYLECCHLGKLTRINDDGPIRGRYGFGDTTGYDLSESTRAMITFKRNSIRYAKRRDALGLAGSHAPKEAGYCMEAVFQQEKDLARRVKDFEPRKTGVLRRASEVLRRKTNWRTKTPCCDDC